MLKAFLPIAVLSASACVIHVHERHHDDGTCSSCDYVSHEETLTFDASGPAGLTIPECVGDVSIEPSDTSSSITVEVHERVAGDAHAVFEDGRLTVRSASGADAYLGRVRVRVSGSLASLDVTTGAGDVSVHDVPVAQALSLTTGAGDVDARDLGTTVRIALSSGAGDVDVARASFQVLEASSGAGDVLVSELEGGDATLSSGAGDVEMRRSHFGRISANTGVGNVACEDVTYASSDFSSGVGDIPHD